MDQKQTAKNKCSPVETEEFLLHEFGNSTYIRKYIGHDAHVVVPDIPGVNAIGPGAFSHNQELEILDFSNITHDSFYLRSAALRDCQNLKKIIFPKAENTSIYFSEGCFIGCSKLADEQGLVIIDDVVYGCIYNPKDVRNIVIPQGVKKIADGAFDSLKYLESVSIPDSVEEIGSAFHWASIESIALPRGLKRISAGAFEGCKLMKEVKIPASVEVAQGFNCCANIIIENGVKRVGSFSYNSELKKIELPESVTEISQHAFYRCDALKKITIKAPMCTLHPEMLFFKDEKDEEKKSKIRIICSKEVAENAPENLKRFCVVEGGQRGDRLTAGGLGGTPLYNMMDQLDIKKMLRDVAPKYTSKKPVFPKSKKYTIDCDGADIQVSLQMRKLPRIRDILEDDIYDFRTAMDFILSKDDVVERIEEVDPNYTSDAAYYAKPMIADEAPTADRKAGERGFSFMVYVAFCLMTENVLQEVIRAMPRKKNGTFYKGRLLRIACPGVVNQESIPQIYAKADDDASVTISVDSRAISEDELLKFEQDFVSTHPELFRLPDYIK